MAGAGRLRRNTPDCPSTRERRHETAAERARRGVERLAGISALLITFLVVAAILTALDIKPDYINIHEDLFYLGDMVQIYFRNYKTNPLITIPFIL